MFKKKSILGLLLLPVLVFGMVCSVDAGLGLKSNWIEVVDEFGQHISSGVIVTIQTLADATATVYKHGYHVSTETMVNDTQTNPAYLGDYDNTTISFYYALNYDLQLADTDGNYIRYENWDNNDHIAVWRIEATQVIGTLSISVKLDVNEEVDVDFDANDEEFVITTTSNSAVGRGILRIIETDTSPTTQHYGVEIWTYSQDDADFDFLVCYASTTKEVKLVINQAGIIIGDDDETLDLGCATDGTILFTDGSNTLFQIVDAGSVGDVTIGGTIDVAGTSNFDVVDIDDATDISAAITQDGPYIKEAPASVVQLDTSTALGVYDSFVLVVGSNAVSGAFAMTSDASAFISTNTATVTQGQEITIMGTSATGTVTLTDGTGCIELDGSTIVLGLGSNITLTYYAGKWWQTGGVNEID